MTYGAVRLPAGGRVLDALTLLLALSWQVMDGSQLQYMLVANPKRRCRVERQDSILVR
jgi:hypothetical protein